MRIGFFVLNHEISLSEVISAISLFGMFLGVIFSMTRLYFEKRFKHAEDVYRLCEKQKNDAGIKRIIYKLDYAEKWYTKEFQRSKSKRDFQRQFDNAILFYDHICYLKQKHLLTNEDYDFFIYDIDIIIKNAEMQDYFYNLYHYTHNKGLPMYFQYLFKYAEEQGVFDEDFKDEYAYKRLNNKYHHYIKFHKSEF